MTNQQSTKAKRIGIIGCGIIADTHVEAILAAVPGAEVFVSDPLPGKAELLRRKYNLKASFQDPSEMLAQGQLFSVHVLSPPRWHIPHAHQCLEAGSNVLVEKPLCFSVTDARALFAFGRSRGLTVCVDHSLLFQPTVLRMRQLLKDASPLSLLHVDSFYGLDADETAGSSLPVTHWKRTIPGGVLMDTLVHPISLAVSLTGVPSELAVATLNVRGNEQMKVMWRANDTLIAVTISQGAQPFRRVTSVVTSEFTCTIDHSAEVLAVQGRGFGPRALKKLVNNVNLSSQLAFGTLHTAWKFARRKIQQNPGTRSLIAAYYRHLAGEGENPVSEDSVLHTTLALQQTAALIEPPSDSKTLGAPSPQPPQSVSPASPSCRVLVTGASGFLGRTLCRRLLESVACSITAQVRRGPNADKLTAHPSLAKHYLDFDQFTAHDFNGLLQGVDAVIHCAHAAGSKTWRDYELRNVAHSLALYEAAALAGCQRFIHISSLAVYGVGSRGGKFLNESEPLTKGGKWEFYIRSKKMAEEALLTRAAKGGPRLLILRPGILYSAGGERLFSKSIPTWKGRLFIFIGSGHNHLPFTRVDTVADLIVRTLQCNPFPEGVFNLSGEQKETVKEFLARRCQKLGVHCSFMHIPAFALRAAAFTLESLHSLAGLQRAPKVTRYIVNSATRNVLYDCTKAGQVLGWNPAQAVAG